MNVRIPETFWLNLKEHVEESDYCYLCNCHPSSEHHWNCPFHPLRYEIDKAKENNE